MTTRAVPRRRDRRVRQPLRAVAGAGAALGLMLSSVAAVAVATAVPARADSSFDQQMLALVNQDRAANGLGPVVSSPTMAAIAEDGPYGGCGYTVTGRAADMGARNYFSHTIPNCSDRQVFDMLSAAGLSYTWAAENIGWESGYTDPAAAAKYINDQFMNSAPHRANILDPDATHVGVGSWHTAPGQTWSGAGPAYADVYVTAVVLARLPAATAQAPSGPGNVSAVAGDGSAQVSWRPAADNGSPVDRYAVYAAGPNGYTGQYAVACGSCTSATVTGLANGSRYTLAVYAHNAVNWSAPADSPSIVAGTPLAPSWVSATPGWGQATAGWGPAPTNGAAIDAYIALAYDANGYTGVYSWGCATCSSAVLGGLAHGHAYVIVVYPHNSRGWGLRAITSWVTVT